MSPARSTNVRFNRTRYRQMLAKETRTAAIWWLVAGLLLLALWYGSTRLELPSVVFGVVILVVLYLLVAPLLLVFDWLDYMRLHVLKK